MEQSKVQTVIRNIAFILVLDLILFPLAVALYLFHGFHIVHIVIGFGYVYGFFMVFETANLLYKHVRIVNDPAHLETQAENFYEEEDSAFCCERNYAGLKCSCNLSYRERGDFDEDSEEPLKPEMRQAMDEVFGINKK